jgi:hypothetical protein
MLDTTVNPYELTKVVYCLMSEPLGFWPGLWEEDLRAPTRDFIKRCFFLVETGVLQLIARAMDASGIPQWLSKFIHNVLDGLAVVALASVALSMVVGIVGGSIGLFRGFGRVAKS